MAEFILPEKHRPSPQDHPAEGKRRFLMNVQFEGTAYCGWQRQENGPSVQQTLEEALCKLTGEHISVVGCSRTDAGVHARSLTAHFDSGTRIPSEKIAFAVNPLLPEDISIQRSALAPEGFHARYSARGKVYAYRFWNGRQPAALGRQVRAHVPVPMDERKMDEAVRQLLGTHDFAAFAASGSVARSTVRTLWRAQVRREGDEVVLFVLGDGFLYNMVRIIAGTLAEIGTGKRPACCLEEALAFGDRLALGMTAPAKGLVLETALYEGDEEKALSYFCGP